MLDMVRWGMEEGVGLESGSQDTFWIKAFIWKFTYFGVNSNKSVERSLQASETPLLALILQAESRAADVDRQAVKCHRYPPARVWVTNTVLVCLQGFSTPICLLLGLWSLYCQPLESAVTHYYPLTAFKPSLPISHLEAGHDGTHLESQELEVGGSLQFGEGDIRQRNPQRLPPSQRVRKPAPSLGKFIYHLTDFTASPPPWRHPWSEKQPRFA